MRRNSFLALATLAAAGASACGSSSNTVPSPGDSDGTTPSETVTVGGSPSTCKVYEVAVPIQMPDWQHWPEGTAIAYDHNPPAGGPSYEMWAAYGEYTDPVGRARWVHNLRHGAIVLIYRPDAPADVVTALRAGLAEVPTPGDLAEPGCPHMGVLTPDPDLDDTFAVLAFGWMMTSNCVPQVADIADFAQRHIYQAPETVCGDGAWPVRAPCFRFEDVALTQWTREVPEGTPVTYDHQPPTSGPFYPTVLKYGVYDVVVPEPYWTGILAKGGIVALYRPDAPADLVAELKREYATLSPHWLCEIPMAAIVQDPNLDHPYAFVGFNQYMTAECLQGFELEAFVASRRFNAPFNSCDDGTWEPATPAAPAPAAPAAP